MDAKYGQFSFPLEDVAEIRFARDRLVKETESAADRVTVRLSPLGQITGRPLSGNGTSIRLMHPSVGDLNLNLDSAVMLDFKPSNAIIDDWNSEL